MEFNFTLTCNKEISVQFACDTTADVICVFLVGGEVSGVWDIPNSTAVVIWPSEDLVTIWGEVCYMYSPEKKYSERLNLISSLSQPDIKSVEQFTSCQKSWDHHEIQSMDHSRNHHSTVLLVQNKFKRHNLQLKRVCDDFLNWFKK